MLDSGTLFLFLFLFLFPFPFLFLVLVLVLVLIPFSVLILIIILIAVSSLHHRSLAPDARRRSLPLLLPEHAGSTVSESTLIPPLIEAPAPIVGNAAP